MTHSIAPVGPTPDQQVCVRGSLHVTCTRVVPLDDIIVAVDLVTLVDMPSPVLGSRPDLR